MSRIVINQDRCKGCGLCVASCRSGAIRLKGFDNSQIFAQIYTLGETWDEEEEAAEEEISI